MHCQKIFFLKYVIRDSRAICPYELRHSLDLSLLKKWPVLLFLQNASGNPRCNLPHERFMREKLFKNEIIENDSQKFHDQWKIG